MSESNDSKAAGPRGLGRGTDVVFAPDIIYPTVAIPIEDFCRRVSTSTTTYYKMRAAGQGPRELRISNGVVRITPEAMRDWVRAREDLANSTEQRRRMKERSERAIAVRDNG